jgi:hypothetical protein
LYRQIHGITGLEAVPEFVVSAGVRGALTLINTLDDSELFLDSEAPKGTVSVMRVFFQLLRKTLAEADAEAWIAVQEFLKTARETGLGQT